MTALHDLTAVEQRQRLAAGEITALELVEHCLARIEARNGELGALVTVTPEAARERAAMLDADRAAGGREASRIEGRPLWGLPFADKDLIHREGVPTSFGSRAFAGTVADADDPLAATMHRAGGISVGKSNAPEFGFPSYTQNLLEGPPARNPWDIERDPGGSSGGAAVAVAAGLLPFAPGSDGGGSIRIPAAACGLVGLKPSRGRVPDGSGLQSLAGLPVAGPLARTTADAALLLDGMIARRDGAVAHRTAVRAPRGEPSYLRALDAPVRPLRIAVNAWTPWSERYEISPAPEALRALDETHLVLRALGHTVVDAAPADFPGYSDAFRTVWQSSAAALPLDDEALERVEPLTRWLVGVGRTRTARDLAEALSLLARFEAHVVEAYREFDAVLTPALAMTARPIGWFDAADGERNFAQQCQFTPYTSYVNVAGLPAIAMPVLADPLPIGVQAIGRPGDEATLLRLSAQLEREFGWAGRKPPGW